MASTYNQVQDFASSVPSSSFGPIPDDTGELDIPLFRAAAQGQLEVVERLVTNGAVQLNEAANIAARYNQELTVYSLIDRGADDYYLIAAGFAESGNWPALDTFLAWSQLTYYLQLELVYYVAKSGDPNRTQLLLRQGASVSSALRGAGVGGHQELILILLQYPYADINMSLSGAARAGNLPLVQWLISQGANKLDWARCAALDTNKQDVVAYLTNLGATEVVPVHASNPPTVREGNIVLIPLGGAFIEETQ